MNRIITFFILTFLLFSFVAAQDTVRQDIIYLKNGEIYRGEIVLKTDEVLMLKTEDGRRYQFQLTEIEKIRQEYKLEKKNQRDSLNQRGFGGILNLNGGAAWAPGAFNISPAGAVSVAIGTKSTFNSNAFLGIGAGYEAVFGIQKKEIGFLPLFIQLHTSLNKNKLSPALGTKIGYAFSLNDLYKGGALAHISGGINYNISSSSAFFLGAFGQVRGIYGTVTEKNQWGEFTAQSNAPLYSFGVSASYIF